ncbi:putative UV-damage endonuclease [Paratrimastix pyriformis]|uniref:UV-damage endonuclease n=1 Tax=Paratrimastix pyriformis TaxID=342808 RepID=A0ABQ8UQX1_9EUKA|nr:putative UV-damage endonuclease [Paratrimastix pyriformis]
MTQKAYKEKASTAPSSRHFTLKSGKLVTTDELDRDTAAPAYELPNLGQEILLQRSEQNILDLLPILQWNEANGIRLFRISSDLFPHCDNRVLKKPVVKAAKKKVPSSRRKRTKKKDDEDEEEDDGGVESSEGDADDAIEEVPISEDMKQAILSEPFLYPLLWAGEGLAECGQFARTWGHRLTMHPSQFNQIGTPTPEVLASTSLCLRMHAAVLDMLDTPDAVLVVHGGGTYGDKAAALRRWERQFALLPAAVRRRIVLENDEKCFSVADLLPLCQRLEVPLVYDTLHGACKGPNHLGETRRRFLDELLPDILRTWRARDIVPKFHVSEQRAGAHTGAHSDFVQSLPDFFMGITDPVDVMIEAKAKEAATLQLMALPDLASLRWGGQVPHRPCVVTAQPVASTAPTAATAALPGVPWTPARAAPPPGLYREMPPHWLVVPDCQMPPPLDPALVAKLVAPKAVRARASKKGSAAARGKATGKPGKRTVVIQDDDNSSDDDPESGGDDASPPVAEETKRPRRQRRIRPLATRQLSFLLPTGTTGYPKLLSVPAKGMYPQNSVFDELHRQARRLEETIDTKLMSFSKLGTSFLATEAAPRAQADQKQKQANDHIFVAMGTDIEQLLSKLTQLNSKMAQFLQENPQAPPTFVHTTSRHEEILKTLTQDYQKTKINNAHCRDHAELLSGVTPGTVLSATDQLLRERSAIHNSDKSADDLLGQAADVTSVLSAQRGVLSTLQNKAAQAAGAFPAIHGIIAKMHARKMRDKVIIAIVVALCVAFILFYVFLRKRK